ncbi:MAG: transposase [Candidatus Dojkabacteria bacterium]|jgi:REP element-mobilizing transposase RayT|nr:transposase [Candidatus Dojkabacteria bacterium]MDD2270311.1 transposase [Candidatus Dojkabacteria bacterium]
MSRRKRNFKKESYYHIYNRGNNKERVFATNDDKRLFICLLFKYRDETDLIFDTYTVMDNHFHLLLKTGDYPKALSTFMQRVCTAYAVTTNRKYRRVGHLFQGRYHANFLRYKKDVKQVRNYIKQNPVKEGCVKKAKDYPWSRFD